MLLFCLLAHFSHLWKQMDYKHLVSVYSSLPSKNITIGCELAMVYGTQIYLILNWIRTSDRQLWDLSTTCRHDAAGVFMLYSSPRRTPAVTALSSNCLALQRSLITRNTPASHTCAVRLCKLTRRSNDWWLDSVISVFASYQNFGLPLISPI